MPVENIPLISARDFGIRIAKAFKEIKSSNVWFFIQQAYKDVGGLEELEWEDAEKIFDRIIAEGESDPGYEVMKKFGEIAYEVLTDDDNGVENISPSHAIEVGRTIFTKVKDEGLLKIPEGKEPK